MVLTFFETALTRILIDGRFNNPNQNENHENHEWRQRSTTGNQFEPIKLLVFLDPQTDFTIQRT